MPLQIQRSGKHDITLDDLRSFLKLLRLLLVSNSNQGRLNLLNQLIYVSLLHPQSLPRRRMQRIMVPSKMVVSLQMSLNFEPPAHSYTISIIVDLKEPTYSSTSTGNLHSLRTRATRRAFSLSLLKGCCISVRTLGASSS